MTLSVLSALSGQSVVRAADYQGKVVEYPAQSVAMDQEPGQVVLVALKAMEFQDRAVVLVLVMGLAKAEEYQVQSVDQVVWVVQVEMVPAAVMGLE